MDRQFQTTKEAREIAAIREQYPHLLTDSPETIALREKLKAAAEKHKAENPEDYHDTRQSKRKAKRRGVHNTSTAKAKRNTKKRRSTNRGSSRSSDGLSF